MSKLPDLHSSFEFACRVWCVHIRQTVRSVEVKLVAGRTESDWLQMNVAGNGFVFDNKDDVPFSYDGIEKLEQHVNQLIQLLWPKDDKHVE